MSTFDIPQGISLQYHGISGQKWGVIRTLKRLGRGSKGTLKVAESHERATIVDGIYHRAYPEISDGRK